MPTGGWHCSVSSCRNNRNKLPRLTAFSIPKNEERCVQWVKAIGRQEDVERKGYKWAQDNFTICQEHFERRYFFNDDRNRLVWNAVPTIFATKAMRREKFAYKNGKKVRIVKDTSSNVLLRHLKPIENDEDEANENEVRLNMQGGSKLKKQPINTVKTELMRQGETYRQRLTERERCRILGYVKREHDYIARPIAEYKTDIQTLEMRYESLKSQHKESTRRCKQLRKEVRRMEAKCRKYDALTASFSQNVSNVLGSLEPVSLDQALGRDKTGQEQEPTATPIPTHMSQLIMTPSGPSANSELPRKSLIERGTQTRTRDVYDGPDGTEGFSTPLVLDDPAERGKEVVLTAGGGQTTRNMTSRERRRLEKREKRLEQDIMKRFPKGIRRDIENDLRRRANKQDTEEELAGEAAQPAEAVHQEVQSEEVLFELEGLGAATVVHEVAAGGGGGGGEEGVPVQLQLLVDEAVGTAEASGSRLIPVNPADVPFLNGGQVQLKPVRPEEVPFLNKPPHEGAGGNSAPTNLVPVRPEDVPFLTKAHLARKDGGSSAPVPNPANLVPVTAPNPANLVPVTAPNPANLVPVAAPNPANLVPIATPNPANLVPLAAPNPANLVPVAAPNPVNLVPVRPEDVPFLPGGIAQILQEVGLDNLESLFGHEAEPEPEPTLTEEQERLLSVPSLEWVEHVEEVGGLPAKLIPKKLPSPKSSNDICETKVVRKMVDINPQLKLRDIAKEAGMARIDKKKGWTVKITPGGRISKRDVQRKGRVRNTKKTSKKKVVKVKLRGRKRKAPEPEPESEEEDGSEDEEFQATVESATLTGKRAASKRVRKVPMKFKQEPESEVEADPLAVESSRKRKKSKALKKEKEMEEVEVGSDLLDFWNE